MDLWFLVYAAVVIRKNGMDGTDYEYKGLLELIMDCICLVPGALKEYERMFGKPFKSF